MVVILPQSLTYGQVVGQFIRAVGDTTADPDRLPNPVAAVGGVTFTPYLSNVKAVSDQNPVTVTKTEILCSLDADGYLIDETGVRGVWLVTGDYAVTYDLEGVILPKHDIVVTVDHTSTPLDLTDAMPPGGPILSASEYAELSARVDSMPPSGSVMFSDTIERPTARADIMVLFTGPDPGLNALDGDRWFG